MAFLPIFLQYCVLRMIRFCTCGVFRRLPSQPLSQEDMVWSLFRHLGLPRQPSVDDVVLWWKRAAVVLGATAVGMGGGKAADNASAVAADGMHTTAAHLALRGATEDNRLGPGLLADLDDDSFEDDFPPTHNALGPGTFEGTV